MHRRTAIALVAACFGLAACSSSSNSEAPEPTPTGTVAAAVATATPTQPPAVPTATATVTPVVASQVVGLAVFGSDVELSEDEAPAAPPEAWLADPDAEAFPRALGFADWTLEGPVGRSGSTAADGSFTIPDLPAGNYTLTMTRTLNGSLLRVVVSFAVGEDGPTELLLQIDRDGVRSQATHTEGGRVVRSISGPDDTRVVTEDDRVVEITVPSRHWVDPDGDGRFVDRSCLVAAPYLCTASEDCDDGLFCQCTASCPFCDDCGPSICAPSLEIPPYRCSEDRSCERPGDACVCVSSCPGCRDCPMSVCVPGCDPMRVESVEVTGAVQVTLGRRAALRAVARFDNGSEMDVTTLARWESSERAIVTIDSWGHAVGRGLGSAEVRATFGTVPSAPHAIEVVRQPALVQLEAYVLDCVVPEILPWPVGESGGARRPHPGWCSDVVRIGGRTSLIAFATYADGSRDVVTERAAWSVLPAAGGEVSRGTFHALQVGEVELRASLDGVESHPLVLHVVDRPTVVALYVYPEAAAVLPREPFDWEDAAEPGLLPPPIFCPDCHAVSRAVVGDTLGFRAMAQFDTGEWEDVTEVANWASDDTAVADFVEPGLLVATSAGETLIEAEIDGVFSEPVAVEVVTEATLQWLHIYHAGRDGSLLPGEEAHLYAWAVYDVGASRDVTREATWTVSDAAVASFQAPGVLVGHTAGAVDVWAELDGVTSAPLAMVVSSASPLDYCDPNDINRVVWSDAVHRIVLESDCQRYTPPDIAQLRYDVTVLPRPDGEAAPCVDLHVWRGDAKVRTLREGDCRASGPAPGDSWRLPLTAYWDLRDDAGRLVEPGHYAIVARLHRQVGPLVRLEVAVAEPDGRIPCRVNPCGNGCGYVYACGDDVELGPCPAICVELCECPAGWGITADGQCEPCGPKCCPENARCTPDVPPCPPAPDRMPCQPNDCGNGCGWVRTCGGPAPPQVCPRICVPLCECPPGWGLSDAGDCVRCPNDCCHPGEICPDGMRTCEFDPGCCPVGQLCDMARPACPIECCPENVRCTPEIPPCNTGPACCPEGALCGVGGIIELPPCPPEPKCCVPGQECPPDVPPCTVPVDDCVVTGCSGQICADREMASTCEWLPEYGCYREAECTRQEDGRCGWTPTEELRACIDGARDAWR